MPKMGGKKQKEESISGYFKKVFKEHPKWLEQKSNALLVERWLRDHPDETEVSDRVKQNLANTKSALRKKLREEAAAPMAFSFPVDEEDEEQEENSGAHKFEPLEEYIDDCMSLAKTLDRDGLESVIKLLRRARNEVVWKIGQ
jgi:hypothetical protein